MLFGGQDREILSIHLKKMYSSVFCLQPVYELVNTELSKSILQGPDSLLYKEGRTRGN